MTFIRALPDCDAESKKLIESFISNFDTFIQPQQKIKKEEVKPEPLNFTELITKINQKIISNKLSTNEKQTEKLTLKQIIGIVDKNLKELTALRTNLEDEINKHQRYCKDAERRR